MKTVMSNEQIAWLDDSIKGYNLAYLGVHGSHLYGVEREGSDIDIKGVYLPSMEDLLLGESCKTRNIKNDKLNIELELKSLPSFLKSCKSCDTNCIDLLHSPPTMGIKTTNLWGKLVSLRSCLYSKRMKGLFGYIRTHTHKYSNKIERYKDLCSLQKLINNYEGLVHISSTGLPEILQRMSLKYITVEFAEKDGMQPHIDVCGKKFIFNSEMHKLQDVVKKEINLRGERTAQGVIQGNDFKSLSHAIRLLFEVREILTTGDLKFPLENRDYIKSVKLGDIESEQMLLDKIDSLYEECVQLVAISEFPEETDITPMLKLLSDYYK